MRLREYVAVASLMIFMWAANCRGDDIGDDIGDSGMCGNGVRDEGELCDGDDLGGESCESLNLVSGQLICAWGCVFDVSGCSGRARCGSRVREYPEECEGEDLGGATCESLGYPFGGRLSCTGDCTFDTTGCCGDGIRAISEDCDGGDLAGNSCATLRLGAGIPTCREDCTFDVSNCSGEAQCGNGRWEYPEACDGADLRGTCESWGFPMGGMFECNPDCTPDFAGCCGDGNTGGGEACDDGNETDWDGCTYCEITEFKVSTQPGVPSYAEPAASMLTDGSFVAVWHNNGMDGDGYGVFGQRVDSAGNLVGPEFQVNTYTQGDQEAPRLAAFPDGSFVVVWQSQGQDGSDWGIFGQAFDASATPVGAEFGINTYTQQSQEHPAIAAMGGGFVVVWQGLGQDGSGAGIFGQMYDQSRTPVGPEFQVNTTSQDHQEKPDVSSAADGSFVVVWQSFGQDGHDWGIFGQRFESSGNPAGPEFQVNTTTEDAQEFPSVSMTADGSFVVVWLESPIGSAPLVQRFDASGGPVGTEFEISPGGTTTYGPSYPSVSAASDGPFAVTWRKDERSFDHAGVFCQRFDANGDPAGIRIQADSLVDDQSHATSPGIAMAPDGRFVVIWSASQPPFEGIFAQRYTADGLPLGTLPF